MTTLTIEAVTVGGNEAGSPPQKVSIPLAAGPATVREILDSIIRVEVANFQARSESQKLFKVLTTQALRQGLAEGTVRNGGREVSADVDPDAAVETALLAYSDGLFHAIIDDEPIDNLDAIVEVGDQTRVMFVRLVPLVGG